MVDNNQNVTNKKLPHEENDDGSYMREAWKHIDDQEETGYFERHERPNLHGYYGDEFEEIEKPSRVSHAGKGPKGWKRSDERICEDVNEALYRSHEVDASDIEVKVENGVVTLSGTVDSRTAKRDAEICVDCIEGVFDVRNQIQIKNSP